MKVTKEASSNYFAISTGIYSIINLIAQIFLVNYAYITCTVLSVMTYD